MLTKGDPHWSLEVQLCQSDHAVKEDLKVQVRTVIFLNFQYPPPESFQCILQILCRYVTDIL